jgi:DNA-binding transcriptional regulator/RsmH inhibitor MraZ
VGVSDAIEIWDADKWAKSIGGLLENFGQAAEDLEKGSTEK